MSGGKRRESQQATGFTIGLLGSAKTTFSTRRCWFMPSKALETPFSFQDIWVCCARKAQGFSSHRKVRYGD